MTLDDLEDLFWNTFDKEVDKNGDNGNGERAGIRAVVMALRDETAISSCACKFWLDDILGSDAGEKKPDPAPVTIKETIAGTVLRMEQGYTGGMDDLCVTDPAPTVGQRLIKAAYEAAAIARGDAEPAAVHHADPVPVCVWVGDDEFWHWTCDSSDEILETEDFKFCPSCGLPIKFTEAQR